MNKKVHPFTTFRPSVERALNGFSKCEPPTVEPGTIKLDRMEFPVPELLLILLRDVMGFSWYGEGDKSRWTTFFAVAGHCFAVEHAKFGLRLHYEPAGEALIGRVTGQLSAALGRLESRLDPILKEQIDLGNVTLANRSSAFASRYRFFREKADIAYRSSKRKVRSRKSTAESDLAAAMNEFVESFGRSMDKRQEGFFFSVAMTDAYFSYLEHRLVLLRAFTGRLVPKGGVEDILAMRWDEKFADLLGSKAADHAALVGRLRDLKERIRNPFAHGGVENDRGSIFCHVPYVGAVPGNMSRTKHSAHFKWVPVESEDHESISQLFDEVDAVLQAGTLSKPALLVDGGVHPAWTSTELKLYRQLVRGQLSAVNHYVEHWNRDQDRHDNMDY